MVILLVGILLALIAVPSLAKLLAPPHRRRIVAVLAISSAIVGWAGLAYTVWGPSYQGFEVTLDSAGRTTQRATSISLLELGLDPRAIAIIVALTLSFATLVVGALAHVADSGLGQWLMLASLVVPLAVASLSFGFAATVPAAILAVAAARLAFVRPTPHPAATA